MGDESGNISLRENVNNEKDRCSDQALQGGHSRHIVSQVSKMKDLERSQKSTEKGYWT